jgi:hypothetical protein
MRDSEIAAFGLVFWMRLGGDLASQICHLSVEQFFTDVASPRLQGRSPFDTSHLHISRMLQRGIYEKCHARGWKIVFRRPDAVNASREHDRTIRMMRHFQKTWILGMRPTPIRSEPCHILPLFTDFHISTVFHFSLLDRLASSVSSMKTVPLFNTFRKMQSSLKGPKQANRIAAALSSWVWARCESVSDSTVVNRRECTMSRSASSLWTSMRKSISILRKEKLRMMRMSKGSYCLANVSMPKNCLRNRFLWIQLWNFAITSSWVIGYPICIDSSS